MSAYRDWVWDDDITLYHQVKSKDVNGKTEVTWTRSVIKDCFYGRKVQRTINGDEIVSTNTHIVRIPASSVSEGFALSKGDIIVKGDVSDTIPKNDSGSSLRAKYPDNCFVVNAVVDNTKLPKTAHWYAAEDL